MKPAPFDYQAPDTLREAIDLLASNPEAFVIAGGQSLMPVLAFRLATPSLLVDLRRLPGLGNIAISDDGFRLGALVRWRDIEDDQRLMAAHPLLHAAVTHVAHYQIRNRGTVGGSLAHADPAAELPGVAVTCEGEITLFGAAGSRTVRAGDFFTGPLSTLRRPDEIVTELRLPKWPSGRRWAFRKYARRDGDFALACFRVLKKMHAARTGGYITFSNLGEVTAAIALPLERAGSHPVTFALVEIVAWRYINFTRCRPAIR